MKPSCLRPQDVLLACKLFAAGERRQDLAYSGLASDLGLSTGEVHNSVERCRQSQVLAASGFQVVKRDLVDLLTYAVPRIYYATRGGLGAGVLTGIYAPPLREEYVARSGGPSRTAQVWPFSSSSEQGETLSPIYPTVPHACLKDPIVYELLALVDVMRVGSRTERGWASSDIERRICSR